MDSIPFWLEEEERVEIRAEYEALHEDGIDAEWRDELPHLRPDFRGAIFHPPDGALQPARFVRRLATMATHEGARRSPNTIASVRSTTSTRSRY